MTDLSINAKRLLSSLISSGPSYRAHLARRLGVSRTTATNIVASLLSSGLLEEQLTDQNSLKNLIGTSPQLGLLAAVTYDHGNCHFTLTTLDGRVLRNLTVSYNLAMPAQERLDLGVNTLRRILAETNCAEHTLIAIHLAVDTQMDSVTGVVYRTRASREWAEANPRETFYRAFSCILFIENTARLRGLGEYKWGAGSPFKDVYYVHLSWGVTSAHIIKGALHSGHHGGAGELGHMVYDWNGPLCSCGRFGCLMQYVSIPAFLRDASASLEYPVGLNEFYQLLASHDAAVEKILSRSADILGRCLVNICHLMAPQAIVLGGEIPRFSTDFTPEVAQVIKAQALPLIAENIHVCSAGDDSPSLSRAGIESLRASATVRNRVPGLHH